MDTTPLDMEDESVETLEGVLDDYGAFDLHGVVGLCTAVAVAPGTLMPSAWLHAIFPDGLPPPDEQAPDVVLGVVMRLYNEVITALDNGEILAPAEDDVAACDSFAAGFVAGAALDSEWTSKRSNWAYAAPFAYLVDRRELVPPDLLAEFDGRGEIRAKQSIRENFADLVLDANESLRSRPAPVVNKSTRVGRNDPCPCGSGKKFKRCCGVAGS